ELDAALGRSLFTDSKRLQQVLKNLLSNAFKFTDEGGVTLRVFPATGGWSAANPSLGLAQSVVAFEVSDTGIGIPPDKQRIIFEAFQQADASTSRRFGGTGLGLAISRELAILLGGEIHLRSTPGPGSTFTLYLPQRFSTPAAVAPDVAPPAEAPEPSTPAPAASPADDRAQLEPDDCVMLVVVENPRHARVLLKLARAAGFKAVAASTG